MAAVIPEKVATILHIALIVNLDIFFASVFDKVLLDYPPRRQNLSQPTIKKIKFL